LGEEVALALARDRMLQVNFAQDAGRPAAHVAGYAVRGSMRAKGPVVRLLVQLIALPARTCLWSEVFASSEHEERAVIANRIAARVAHAVRTAEARQHGSVALMPLCLQAARMARQGRAGNEAALAVLRGVLDRAPDLDIAHALMARCYHVQRIMGWRAPSDSALEEGIPHARQAIILGADNADALWMAGLAFLNIEGDLAAAQSAIERAIACDPASTNARLAASFLSCQLGDGHAAIARAREAEALNAADTTHHVLPSAMATAHFIAGDYARANAACDISLAQRPGYAAALRIKVAAASLLGQRDEATIAARQLLTIEPHASVSRMRDYWRWLAPNAPDALAAKLEGWRRAHLPE
jgi:tetratricopeptide (TPR) repeat protein